MVTKSHGPPSRVYGLAAGSRRLWFRSFRGFGSEASGLLMNRGNSGMLNDNSNLDFFG